MSDNGQADNGKPQVVEARRQWVGENIFDVQMDDEYRFIGCHLRLAREQASSPQGIGARLAAVKTLVLAALPHNAVVLANDTKLDEDARQTYHRFVFSPSPEQAKLSFALSHAIACCRYYHAYLFVLLMEAGLQARACGKMLPGLGFGYTWVVVAGEGGEEVVVDLFAETLAKAGRSELGYRDPSGKYQNPGLVYQFSSAR
ncbi:hypothetical protein EPN28_03490 [Patescibacteria group bacterium]|nr:MAG: hypothetical protein EPN28_03490 [Patescibacteria group bacterium]